jgi:hypothetical protein
MTCELVRTHLSAFMDAALPGSTMADVWKHIEICRTCHEVYDTLCLADRFYSAATTLDVPEDYRRSLRVRMEAEGPGGHGPVARCARRTYRGGYFKKRRAAFAAGTRRV